jgi:aspartyl-tRNA(Asn)/glutamyl-tRNA(Gln) amidotransferase subunit B
MADFFEECMKKCERLSQRGRRVAYWLMGPVLAQMNMRGVPLGKLGLTPPSLVELILLVEDGEISNLAGKDVLRQMCDTGKEAAVIVEEKGLAQVSGEEALGVIVDEVIKQNGKVAADYRSGKESALMFLVGQVMRLSQGKANPKVAQELLKKRLSS